MVMAEDAVESVARLQAAGYLCICVTNQPDFARGTRTLENIAAMNARVERELGLDDLLTCLHDGPDHCLCRKPKPGLLLEAARKWNLNLPSCWMVGDRASDVEAGKNAGCRTVFLDRGYDRPAGIAPDHVCTSLAQGTECIVRAGREQGEP
jgi:D-glycero-D-manno-heptose 1,7-bisphosphate phosphatase